MVPFQPGPGAKTTEGKPHAGTERAASQQPTAKSETKTLVGRNIYESNGKEASAEPKDKATNGEGATNGSAEPKDLEAAIKEPQQVIHCYSCGVDCTRVYYEHKAADAAAGAKPAQQLNLCPRCLYDGHGPASAKKSDFVKVERPEATPATEEDKWTDEEVLRLLEALEMYDDDWNKVADTVATKSREQCVMKFLQLEIEDKYIEPEMNQPPAGTTPNSFLKDLEYLSEGRMPVYHADNPVLSVVSFLAGLAPPNVTVAGASGKSVEVMRKEIQKKMDQMPSTSASDKGKEKEATPADASAVKNEDAMEVDTTPASTSNAQSSESNPLATLPFALSAARASALASHEERHITRLVSGTVNLQLQKLQLKLAHFNDFEKLLSAERRDLQRRRQQLFMDRVNFQRRVRALEEATKKIGGNLGGQGLPGAVSPDDAVKALTEAIRQFGVGKGDESFGVKKDGVDGGQPLGEGVDGYSKLEI